MHYAGNQLYTPRNKKLGELKKEERNLINGTYTFERSDGVRLTSYRLLTRIRLQPDMTKYTF